MGENRFIQLELGRSQHVKIGLADTDFVLTIFQGDEEIGQIDISTALQTGHLPDGSVIVCTVDWWSTGETDAKLNAGVFYAGISLDDLHEEFAGGIDLPAMEGVVMRLPCGGLLATIQIPTVVDASHPTLIKSNVGRILYAELAVSAELVGEAKNVQPAS